MTQRVDMVRELIDRMLEASQRDGCLTEDIAIQIEQQFRRQFCGAECVISETPRYQERRRRNEVRQAVVTDYLSDKPIDLITSEHGISRATLYRYLKTK